MGSGPGACDQMIHPARNAMPVIRSAVIIGAGEAEIEGLTLQVREAVTSQSSVTCAIDLVCAWIRTAWNSNDP